MCKYIIILYNISLYLYIIILILYPIIYVYYIPHRHLKKLTPRPLAIIGNELSKNCWKVKIKQKNFAPWSNNRLHRRNSLNLTIDPNWTDASSPYSSPFYSTLFLRRDGHRSWILRFGMKNTLDFSRCSDRHSLRSKLRALASKATITGRLDSRYKFLFDQTLQTDLATRANSSKNPSKNEGNVGTKLNEDRGLKTRVKRITLPLPRLTEGETNWPGKSALSLLSQRIVG